MKKKILVLQFRTDKSLIHERACIIQTGNFNKAEFNFINILKPHSQALKLIDLDLYKGVILGGSGQVNISDWSPKRKEIILRIKPLIKQIIKKDIPMLNICFGHQLIAYILGGKVTADPDQAETGSFKIFLNENGRLCPIFKGVPKSFYAIEGHKNSVVNLPKGAKLLAFSNKCKIESYQLKNNIYCIQFHPELDRNGMKFRLNLFPNYAQGKNINEILKNYRSTPFAAKILKNFKNICNHNAG